MYESPIEIIQSEMQTEYENGILRAVQKYDIHCNKEELTKALAYDRDQYRKGYEDAKPRWIPCSERLPKDCQRVLIQVINGNMYVINFSAVGETSHIVAWMPLPDPYREETK